MYGEKNPAYGKGGHNQNHTIESKQKMSIARKGKRTLGENSNAKKVLDRETNQIYDSAKEISIKLNINYSTLKAWLQKINKSNGRFEYVV